MTFDSDSTYVEFRGLKSPVSANNLKGFRIYFEIYSLDSLTSQGSTRTKPPRTTPNLFITASLEILNYFKF